VQRKFGPRCLRNVATRTPTAAAAAHAVFNGDGSPVRFVPGGRRHETAGAHQRGIRRRDIRV